MVEQLPPTTNFDETAAVERETAVKHNLQDLRGRLTMRLAIMALAAAQLSIIGIESPNRFPIEVMAYWFTLTLVAGGTMWLNERNPTVARHLLVWGLTAVLIEAMVLFPTPWLPFWGLLLVICAALLIQGSEIASAVVVTGTAVYLHTQGIRTYEIAGLITLNLLAIIIAFLAIRTLYTALDWLWRTHQKAERLLETTRAQQGKLQSMVKSLQITNELRFQAERELMIANKQAREAQQLKEQFAANISHELRTPLSIILGFSEVMYLSPEVYGDMTWTPKLYRDINQIYRNSRHLMGMIDDILDLSHFEMTGFTLHKEPTHFAPLVMETAELVSELFHNNKVVLNVDVPANLPILELDRTRIRQVLLNLLNNARRFTEDGEVSVSVRKLDDAVEVRVHDTGPGIEPEQLKKIFTEFYQVDYSMKREHGGAGLGLAICQRFVQAHDGRIWAESTPGDGSTFIFTLPVDGDGRRNGRLFQSRTIDPPPAKTAPRLFVVDPDPAIANLVQRHVDDFEVLPVADENELVEQVSTYHPAGIVWNLPPGEKLPQSLLQDVPVPVIGCSLPSQAWMAHTLGASASLSKPLDFKQLQDEMDRIGNVKHIFVIDDNPGVCQLVERGVGAMKRPLTVRVAYDGENGLAAMHRQPPDLLLLDLMMPEMDGFQVFEQMQRDPVLKDVKVVLLTATSYPEDHLAQRGSHITVYRTDQLRPVEVLRCISPILSALPPKWGETAVTSQTN